MSQEKIINILENNKPIELLNYINTLHDNGKLQDIINSHIAGNATILRFVLRKAADDELNQNDTATYVKCANILIDNNADLASPTTQINDMINNYFRLKNLVASKELHLDAQTDGNGNTTYSAHIPVVVTEAISKTEEVTATLPQATTHKDDTTKLENTTEEPSNGNIRICHETNMVYFKKEAALNGTMDAYIKTNAFAARYLQNAITPARAIVKVTPTLSKAKEVTTTEAEIAPTEVVEQTVHIEEKINELCTYWKKNLDDFLPIDIDQVKKLAKTVDLTQELLTQELCGNILHAILQHKHSGPNVTKNIENTTDNILKIVKILAEQENFDQMINQVPNTGTKYTPFQLLIEQISQSLAGKNTNKEAITNNYLEVANILIAHGASCDTQPNQDKHYSVNTAMLSYIEDLGSLINSGRLHLRAEKDDNGNITYHANVPAKAVPALAEAEEVTTTIPDVIQSIFELTNYHEDSASYVMLQGFYEHFDNHTFLV